MTKPLHAFGLLAWCALALPAAAQGNGVTLLAKVKNYQAYSSIWGYTAPNGDEYAIIGTTTGTAFYNCADPTAPYEVGFVPGPTSIWREMKTWDHYAYIVTEGGGGVQIVNLANPENPVLVKTWGTTHWGNAHTIGVDLGTGRAYINGTNNGMRVISLANPENPVLVATYTADYVHDIHVQNGQAHTAEIYGGRYRILNVNNLPNFPEKDSVLTAGRFCHNTWANANDTICITTDEVSGGGLGIYDISNPTNIRQLSFWTINPNSMVHNVYIVGDRAYCAWYTEGLVVTDISNPSSPQFVGSYDTSSYSPGTGFHGAWGCYPFSPSGTIYISDIEEGLHVLRVDGPSISLAHANPLPNTEDENGPYSPRITASPLIGGASVSGVDLWYRVEGGSWRTTAMAPTGNPDEWSGDVPGQLSPAVVEYYFYASDSQGNHQWLPASAYPGDDTFSFSVGRILQVYTQGFEGPGDAGWTHGGAYGQDDWQRGAPAGRSGNSHRHAGTAWYDPGAAASGAACWGNDLGAASDGAYAALSSNWLQSPAIDCRGVSNAKLIFQRWLNVEGSPYDNARILVNGNVVWENPVGRAGDSFHIIDSQWRQQVYDISAYADDNPAVVIRFELTSDNAMELGGWNLDDLEIVSLQKVPALNSIVLAGPSSGAVGGTVSYTVSNAPANAPYQLVYSPNLNGFTYLGHPFDVGQPITVGAAGLIDANGGASVTSPPLPPGAAGLTIHLEVGALAAGLVYDSNVVTLNIQ